MRAGAVALAMLMLAAIQGPVVEGWAAPPRPPKPATSSGPVPPSLRHASRTRQPKAKPATPALAPASSWAWQNPKPNGNALFAISCPTTSTCFTAGDNGPILMTGNGGASWTQQTTATGIFSISCASTTVCVAVGANGLVMSTANGGGSWSSQTISGGNFLSGVSCPSTTVCFAVGFAGAVFTTANGGTTWSPQTSSITANLFAISCPSVSVCFAVGDMWTIVGTTNGGSTWARQYLPAYAPQPLTGISCSTVLACTAVGLNGSINGVLVSTADGITWSFPLTIQVPMSGVSCWAAEQCVGTQTDGGTLLTSTSGIGEGSASASETGSLFAISCPAAGVCFASGDYGVVLSTTNGATGWKLKPPAILHDVPSITCPTTSICYAGSFSDAYNGAGMLASTDGGATWFLQNSYSQVSLARFAPNVSCPTATTCYATDYDGYPSANSARIDKTIDGGFSWSAKDVPLAQTNLSGITCPSTIVCYAFGSGVILTTTDGVAWGTNNAPSSSNISGISCPTTTVCFASNFLGGILLTTNGGTAWTSQTTANTGWRGISCVTTSACFAVGDHGMIGTTNGGTTWTDETPAGVTDSFYSVSCPTSTSCYAVASTGAIYATTDGSTWHAQTSGTTNQLNSVSCPSATVCFAAGAKGLVLGTTDGGASAWKLLAPTGIPTDVNGMSCPSSTACFAATFTQLFATSNGGGLWKSVLTDLSMNFTGISCPSSSVCFAIGTNNYGWTATAQLFGTTDGGSTWPTKLNLNTSETVDAINCPSTTVCYAGSTQGTVWRTVDGWLTYHEYHATATGVTAISCPSTTLCFATDDVQNGMNFSPGNVYSSVNGGVNWNISFNLSQDTQAVVYAPFSSIDCPSATVCYAGGRFAGLMAATTDGGAHWHTDFIPGGFGVSGLSCPSPNECYASDLNLLHTSDYGATWSVQSGLTYFAAISCPSTTTCIAGGNVGWVDTTVNGGAAWTTKLPTGTTNSIFGLTCTGGTCYAAAGENLLASPDSGSTWTNHVLGSGDLIDSVSCPAAGTCFAVGWPGAIYRTGDGGTTWTYQPTTISGSDETLTSVSCWSVTSCVAVGSDGIALSTSNGSTWSRETSGTTQLLNGVSCPSSSSCVAVGLAGLTLTRTSGTWHQHPIGTTKGVFAVSCPTASLCDAVGESGLLVTSANGGVSWTTKGSGTANNLYGIQCLKPGVCLAVGAMGTAVFVEDGVTWSTLALPTTLTLFSAAFTGSVQAEVGGVGGTILGDPNLVQLCTSAALSTNFASPQPRGGTIVITANSSGCSSARYEFWLLYPNGTWVLKQAFSPSATWSWDTSGYAAGSYTVHVWANQAGDSPATYQALGGLSFSLTPPATCTTAVLSPGASSQPAGSSVTLTADATGCPNPRFEFWAQYPDASWHLIQAFGVDAFVIWDTTGLKPGNYTVHLWANQAGDSTATFEALGAATVTLTGCTTASVTAPASAPAGTMVSMTGAGSAGCPNPVFEYYVQYPDMSWHLGRTWGAAAWSWDTTGLKPGSYLIHAWTNQSGASLATYEAIGSASLTLTGCTAASVAQDSTTSTVGTPVMFTVTPTCTGTPVFEYWMQYPDMTWHNLSAGFTTSDTFNWVTTGRAKGTYVLHVWVNNQGADTSIYETIGPATHTLT